MSWLQMPTGGVWDFDSQVKEINEHDVASGLSKLCRYNGATTIFYSVAEHSVLLSRYMPALGYELLLHDAHEIITGDIIRPLKVAVPGLRDFEKEIQKQVLRNFGIEELPAEVSVLDNRILVDEQRQVMERCWRSWETEHLEPLGIYIEGWEPDRAKHEFLKRFREL